MGTKTPPEASASATTVDPNLVSVRVLPQGHRKVFTGETNESANEEPLSQDPDDVPNEDGEKRFPTHPKGAIFQIHKKVALALEARGFVEIQEPAPAPATLGEPAT